ncbi:hypothetical protein VCUG_00037 [Vavraia culicis subsp. floridensis]|uniref:Uncharacterized protein n=1 Tax=Vavraia culicis (isolate floridensis) TaxID=948595 RepID=L2GYT5_VAVCU|nr:uncharacterized protein VCUG_00037 [Vavraia culicis subsp. floridensis]ELA48428.1 hypothetical protein VCUG_00037 [Vavraia culicis subsp. floridensis]
MLVKERLFLKNMFLAIILSIIVIFIHFNEEYNVYVDQITTRNNKLHRFLELNADNYRELLSDDWILSVNYKIDPYEEMGIYELLYTVNIAFLSLNSFENVRIFDLLCLSKIPAFYYVKNGVVLDQGNKIVTSLDLDRKNDLINVVDFYILSKVHDMYDYLRKFMKRMH